jgi:hypothetical protein
MLNIGNEMGVDELVGFNMEAEMTLLVVQEEVEELIFELEVLVPEVVLDVLELAVGVAVHCPVNEGTASTPEPIGTTFDPQLAA